MAFLANFLLFLPLCRIPKALSDKAFTDIRTKQAAAATSAKQAQTKGESINALVMTLFGAECKKCVRFGYGPERLPQFLEA